MAQTRTFNISALSPILTYDPQQDLNNAVWKSDVGGMQNNNANTGNPGRVLQGTGTVTVSGFGTGIGFAGSIQGVYCTYTATLSAGQGNQDSSSLPSPQTSPPATGMLASFTGLQVGNWELQLKGDCQSGSFIRITEGVVEGWVGAQDGQVSNQTLDDTSSQLQYSGVAWSTTTGLSAPFYGDSQHYTSTNGATMNLTFQGSAIVVWSSVDGQHGPYSVELHKADGSYNSENALQYSGLNPFLAVPVPFYFASGLDPSQSYTLVLENTSTNGSYLDLDYIDIYTATGSGPPQGGLQPGQNANPGQGNQSGSTSNKTAIIAGSVGGGVVAILLAILIFLLIRHRRTKVDRRGVRPVIDAKAGSSVGHAAPVGTHDNTFPIPYTPQQQRYVAERQGLLTSSYGTGPGSPSMTQPTIPSSNAPTSVTSSSGAYNPYAAYGGELAAHPGSVYSGITSSAPTAPTDPVQARRQGKAAEVEAARERMRVANAEGSIVSPTTPHPTESITQSWDNSSQTGVTPHTTGLPHPINVPDEPPPSYD